MQKVIIQTKRKDRITSLKCGFMNPKLLVFAVVLAILFVAIGASMSSTQGTMEDTLKGPMEQFFQSQKKTTRPSFLVVPMFDQGGSSLLFSLKVFYEMYPEARLPKEFLSISSEGVGFYEGHKWPDSILYPSVLLTLAYQWGYQIETATDTYIILVKYVNIESEEKGENNAESNDSD